MQHERTDSNGAPCHHCGTTLQTGSWFCTNCGGPAIAAVAADRPAPPRPPTPDLPGYTVLDELGAGGTAVVYRARQDTLDREVAVKVLRPDVADPHAWNRFEREARIIASLSGHPHVVNTFDVGRTAIGQPFLVTELLDGGSVGDAIDRDGPLSNSAAVDLGIAIASALAAAHERGILHRDVKPANVLLGSRGQIKLADFGVARLMANHAHTTTGTIACTPEHAAPEVLRGEHEGAATDVYGLASTVATALLGRSLFVRHGDERIEALMWRKLNEQPAALPPTVPTDLALLLGRCLAIDPTARPTLDDVASELAFLRPRMGTSDDAASTTTTVLGVQPPRTEELQQVATQAMPAVAAPPVPTAAAIDDVNASSVDDDSGEADEDDRFSGLGWIAAAAVVLACVVGAVALLRGGSDDGVGVADTPATEVSVVTPPATEASTAPSTTPATVEPSAPATTTPSTTAATTAPTTSPPSTLPASTDAPVTTATATTAANEVVLPPAPPAATGDRITEDEAIMVVVWYYEQVAAQNFAETWPRLTQEFRDARDLTYEDYVGYWTSNSIEISNLRFTAGPGADEARVRFDARYDTGERIVEQVDELILRRGSEGGLVIAAQNRVD